MRFKKNVLALSTALACASTVPLQPALAQDQSGDEMDVLLEEVIVTARKREESLQEIPVAITAFGAQEIAAQDAANPQGSVEPRETQDDARTRLQGC